MGGTTSSRYNRRIILLVSLWRLHPANDAALMNPLPICVCWLGSYETTPAPRTELPPFQRRKARRNFMAEFAATALRRKGCAGRRNLASSLGMEGRT